MDILGWEDFIWRKIEICDSKNTCYEKEEFRKFIKFQIIQKISQNLKN